MPLRPVQWREQSLKKRKVQASHGRYALTVNYFGLIALWQHPGRVVKMQAVDYPLRGSADALHVNWQEFYPLRDGRLMLRPSVARALQYRARRQPKLFTPEGAPHRFMQRLELRRLGFLEGRERQAVAKIFIVQAEALIALVAGRHRHHIPGQGPLEKACRRYKIDVLSGVAAVNARLGHWARQHLALLQQNCNWRGYSASNFSGLIA